MIKIEATVPKRDNEGNLFRTADFLKVETYLLTAVGGYSSYEASGAWKDTDGKVYYDHSIVYVAVVPDLLADSICESLKNIILNDFRQLSAWITQSPITVYN